jgi:hypothetical protein
VPGAAARQAELVAADPDPLEVRRRGDHFAHQLLVGGLEVGALAQGPASVGDPLGQLVAQPLQLTEVEDARLWRHRGDAVLDRGMAEGGGEEAGELPLEPADLASQLDPGGALVDLDGRRPKALGSQQIWHLRTSEFSSLRRPGQLRTARRSGAPRRRSRAPPLRRSEALR